MLIKNNYNIILAEHLKIQLNMLIIFLENTPIVKLRQKIKNIILNITLNSIQKQKKYIYDILYDIL